MTAWLGIPAAPTMPSGPVVDWIMYVAACPGCGRDAAWTSHAVAQGGEAPRTAVTVACRVCAPSVGAA